MEVNKMEFNVMDTVYISTNGVVVECILQQKNI